MKQSTDCVAVVTGASRGAGRGIAVALGAAGATVYLTGRTRNEGDAPLPGTVGNAAEAVTSAGGLGIGVYCDHGEDEQVKQFYQHQQEREETEALRQEGRAALFAGDAEPLSETIERLRELAPTYSGRSRRQARDVLKFLEAGYEGLETNQELPLKVTQTAC